MNEGDARQWWINEGEGKITTWEELVEKFFCKFYPESYDGEEEMLDEGNNWGIDPLEFISRVNSSLKNHRRVDGRTKKNNYLTLPGLNTLPVGTKLSLPVLTKIITLPAGTIYLPVGTTTLPPIRHIHQGRYGVYVPALTKDHEGNKIQYTVSRNDQYAVFKPYGNKIFWKISNVVPTLRNPRYAVSKTLDRP
ncbi:hypothetical protein Tco_1513210, partial [Tanacetum coccineum]